MHGKPGQHDQSLWFYTDQVDRLCQLLKSRQLAAAQASLSEQPPPGGPEAGSSSPPTDHEPIEFVAEIYEPPYGGREFAIRDLNGYALYFRQVTRFE